MQLANEGMQVFAAVLAFLASTCASFVTGLVERCFVTSEAIALRRPKTAEGQTPVTKSCRGKFVSRSNPLSVIAMVSDIPNPLAST